MMEILGYVAAIFIGISLGLMGGGGSILSVPVLVYLFGIDVGVATTYSLFIIAGASAVGSVSYIKEGLVNVKMAMIYGIPSVLSVLLTRSFILPTIATDIVSIGGFVLTKNLMLLLLFAVLMIFASYSMIKKRKDSVDDKAIGAQQFNYSIIFMQGIFTGVITGLVGAGGGFLIIPVLVNVLKIDMKAAVGTSLFIIMVNSSMGFIFSIGNTAIDWRFLLSITLIAMVGIIIGSFISKKIDGKKLKPAFGWFVLVMGIYIIIKETILK